VNKTLCQSLRVLFGPYVDGELSGADRMRVSRHLDACEACACEVDEMTGIGNLLRRASAEDRLPGDIKALASAVVTRVRAESAVSWAAKFETAVADTRLLWVGTGAVFGAMATMMVVVGALFFSQALARAPEAFGQAGTLIAVAQVGDGRNEDFLVRYDTQGGERVITEEMLSERQLAARLSDLVTRRGRVVGLDEMTADERAQTVALLERYLRLQNLELVRVEVQQVRLITTTDVSAKGL